MTRQEIIDLIHHPEKATNSTLGELEQVIIEYPYFQSLQVLRAKVSDVLNAADKQTYISKAAIHTADRANLKRLLESSVQAIIAVPVAQEVKESKPTPTPEPAKKEEVVKKVLDFEYSSKEVNETSEALFKEVMENLQTLHSLRKKYEYLEEQSEKAEKVSNKKTAKKSNKKLPSPSSTETKKTPRTSKKSSRKINEDTSEKDEGDDPVKSNNNTEDNKPYQRIDMVEQNFIIESFIKKEPEISKKQPEKENKNREDLSIKSTVITDGLVSENLAEIFVGQGKTERAIEIYKKLIWKFPQKKSYFASRIKEISK